MQEHKSLEDKIYNLCKFLSQSEESTHVNTLMRKSRQLGLPVSPLFTKERYVYNIALAAITTMLELHQGFELAAIFLKDICPTSTYWDILHFLHDFQQEILHSFSSFDDVIERVKVYNIVVCHDLNTTYCCQCSLRHLSRLHLRSHSHPVPACSQSSASGQPWGKVRKSWWTTMNDCNGQEIPPIANSNKSNKINTGGLSDITQYPCSTPQFILVDENQDHNLQGIKGSVIEVLESPNQNLSNRITINIQPDSHEIENLQSQNYHNEPSSEKMERCELCLQLYHPFCQPQQLLVCNKCYLKQNSLDNRVISNLFTGYVHPSSYLTVVDFPCPNVISAKTQYCDSFIVELRFQNFKQKLTEKDTGKENRPRNGSRIQRVDKKKKKASSKLFFYLNYQPIGMRASSESQEIQYIKIPLKYLQEKNSLIIERKNNQTREGQSAQLENYMLLGIYQVVPRTRRKQIISNSVTSLSEKTMNLFYQKYLKKHKMNSINVSLLSGVTNMPMTTPVRSYQCTHPACFDYSEISQMISRSEPSRVCFMKSARKYNIAQTQAIDEKQTQKSSGIRRIIKKPKKPECPLCGVIMKGLYLDNFILKNIEMGLKDEVEVLAQEIHEQEEQIYIESVSQRVQILFSHEETIQENLLSELKDGFLEAQSKTLPNQIVQVPNQQSSPESLKPMGREEKSTLILQIEDSQDFCLEHSIYDVPESSSIQQISEISRAGSDFYILIDQIPFTQEV